MEIFCFAVDRPRILGLTASLINSKTSPSSLEQLLERLERIMHSAIETASDLVSVNICYHYFQPIFMQLVLVFLLMMLEC